MKCTWFLLCGELLWAGMLSRVSGKLVKSGQDGRCGVRCLVSKWTGDR